MEEKKSIKKLVRDVIISIIMLSVSAVMVYYALILPHELNEEVIKIEPREVLNGEYINVDGKDYVLLQIKYDDYSKLEKYSIYDIVFKDRDDIDQPYLIVYLNRNDRVLKSELFY
ncbi:MAG: hypothetical protein NSGCLCUN01_02854 [uncultured Clostridium sp.]